jgi:hypothetical protein
MHLALQLEALRDDLQHHFSGDDQREEIIHEYEGILDEVNQRMPELFSFGSLGRSPFNGCRNSKNRIRRLPTPNPRPWTAAGRARYG